MKRYRVVLWLLVAAMIFCIASGVFIMKAGSSPKITEIRTEEDLLKFLDKSTSPPHVHAVLAEDITLNTVFEPCDFVGMLDGCGHTVAIGNNRVEKLFVSISEDSTVRNLNIKGTFGYSDSSVASGICDCNFGSIENCCVLSNFCAASSASGICGQNAGTIINCAVLGKGFPAGEEEFAWYPITSDNPGSTENCFYRNDAENLTGSEGGVGLEIAECTDGSLMSTLESFARHKSGYASWKSGSDGLPLLQPEGAGATASVFSSSVETLWLLTTIVVMVLLMIYLIYYFDMRKNYLRKKEAEK